jgi:hypothetical protein
MKTMSSPVRHVMVITRYPGQDIVVTIDGNQVQYVTGKFTPNVIRFVYEEEGGTDGD